MSVINDTAADVVLRLQGAASQSGQALRFQDSSARELFSVASNSVITASGISSASVSRQLYDIVGEFVDSTDATRKGRIRFRAWDTTTREGFRVEASGSAPMMGFLGNAAIARPAAYTQNFTGTSRTVNAYTTDAESGAYTGIDNAQAGTPYAQLTDLNALRTAYENLRASYDNVIMVVTQVIDDFQNYGLLG
jgi:hypothetical protein